MGKIYLREACWDDKDFLFNLVNDEGCRKNSLNPKHIPLVEHERWFKKALDMGTQRIYILLDDGRRIGQGRLELRDEGCRISYSIVPEWRGCGYGGYLLEALCPMVAEVFPRCRRVYGEVLRWNVASQRIFADLGFSAEERADYLIYYKDV